MKGVELHSRAMGSLPESPSSHGDELSESAFGKRQTAADSADMHRMGKKQELRVRIICQRYEAKN